MVSSDETLFRVLHHSHCSKCFIWCQLFLLNETQFTVIFTTYIPYDISNLTDPKTSNKILLDETWFHQIKQVGDYFWKYKLSWDNILKGVSENFLSSTLR